MDVRVVRSNRTGWYGLWPHVYTQKSVSLSCPISSLEYRVTSDTECQLSGWHKSQTKCVSQLCKILCSEEYSNITSNYIYWVMLNRIRILIVFLTAIS